MRILVDADATPSIDLITQFAKENKIELILYIDDSHFIQNSYATIIQVSKGFQSVDIRISNDIKKQDILITQDYGLAVIGLCKKSVVVHPKGFIYDNTNIDTILYERYLNSKNRKINHHIKGPKKRAKQDDINLLNSLKKIIQNMK